MQTTTYKKIEETIFTEVLDNGLCVCLIPKQGISKSSAIFTTDYGSNDIRFVPIGETEPITAPLGVAHFLEHKMFDKGFQDVVADFSKLGATVNAYTSSTQTSYLFTATDNVEQNVELLLDFVQTPYFTDETVEKEKGIIVQEAQMYLDNPEHRLYMGTLKALFQNHPIKDPVIGTIDSINETTKEDLYTCYHTFYHPTNMTLCLTGNFDPQIMMRKIRNNQAKKQFAKPQKIQRFAVDEPWEVAQTKMAIAMPVSTAKCMIGIKEYGRKVNQTEFRHRLLLTNMVLDYLFGQSGPFYKQLYDQGLIDQSFRYRNICELDFGYSLIQGNTKDPDAYVALVKKLLVSTRSLKLSQQTFERMKKRVIGRLLRGMNDIEGTAQQYTWYRNRGLDYFEIIPIIQALTLDEAHAFISNWIEADRLTVCTITAK